MTVAGRLGISRFLKFCAVGTLGFLADTGLLWALVRMGHIEPVLAKPLSFGFAVLVTFGCNRTWAFGTVAPASWSSSFFLYLGVQSTGFMINWMVFSLCQWLPSFEGRLIASAALASGAALAFNYLGALRWVFRDSDPRAIG